MDAINGKVSGNIQGKMDTVSGNVISTMPKISGVAQPAGSTIVYDAKWGGIKGDIENQTDLMNALEEKQDEMDSITEQDIDNMIYGGN